MKNYKSRRLVSVNWLQKTHYLTVPFLRSYRARWVCLHQEKATDLWTSSVTEIATNRLVFYRKNPARELRRLMEKFQGQDTSSAKPNIKQRFTMPYGRLILVWSIVNLPIISKRIPVQNLIRHITLNKRHIHQDYNKLLIAMSAIRWRISFPTPSFACPDKPCITALK